MSAVQVGHSHCSEAAVVGFEHPVKGQVPLFLHLVLLTVGTVSLAVGSALLAMLPSHILSNIDMPAAGLQRFHRTLSLFVRVAPAGVLGRVLEQ